MPRPLKVKIGPTFAAELKAKGLDPGQVPVAWDIVTGDIITGQPITAQQRAIVDEVLAKHDPTRDPSKKE